MQFPIYNIDIVSLGDNYWLLQEIIRYDAIYSSRDEKIWRKYFLNKRFADSQGNVYMLVDKSEIKKRWYDLFCTNRFHCHFLFTGERLSIEDVRRIMEKQIRDTHEKFEEEFIAGLRKAKTFEELISWKTVDIDGRQRSSHSLHKN